MSIEVKHINNPYVASNMLKEYIHHTDFIGVAMMGEYLALASTELIIYFSRFTNAPDLEEDLVFLFDSIHPLKVTFMFDDQRERWLRLRRAF